MSVFDQLLQVLGCTELRMPFRGTPRNQPLRDYLSAKFTMQANVYVIARDALAPTPHIQSS